MQNNPVKKERSFRWAITIGLIIGTICVTAFAFLYKLPSVGKFEADSAGIHVEQPNGAFLSVATQNEEATVPFLKTGFDHIFFTVNDDNSVTFYEYKNENFSKLKASTSIKVTLPQGKEKALVDIAILEKDGVCEGYGVYTDPESVKLPYIFVKLTSNNISKDKYDYLLYVDYSIDDFYKNEKSYSMLYAFNTEDNELKAVFSNKGVTSGPDGLVNDSYTLIPGNFSALSPDAFYYVTDRNYEPGKAFDLYKKAGVNDKEELVCKNLASPYLFVVDKEVCFFMRDAEKEDSNEFYLCNLTDNTPKKIRTYSGSPEQYTIRDNYIFNAAAKMLYNVENGKTYGIHTNISINTVQDFTVNADGTKFALAGTFAGNSEKLFFYNLGNDRSNTIEGADLFVSNHSNLAFLDDSVYIVMPGTTSDKITNFVISWDAIFSIH